MIRFIDLRGQVFNDDDLPEAEREPLFAFYDTVINSFLEFGGCTTWRDAASFVRSWNREAARVDGLPWSAYNRDRLTGLMPEWARKEPR